MTRLLYTIVFAVLITGCHFNRSSHLELLNSLDGIIEEQPVAVLDSLKKIDPKTLNAHDQAHYHLLVACATDKTYTYMENDSTLKIAVDYFANHKDYYNLARTQYYLAKYLNNQKEPEKAFNLLKQAEISFEKSDKREFHIAGLIYYWLGLIQDKQSNFTEAENYYEKSRDMFLASKDTMSTIYSLRQLGQLSTKSNNYDKAKDFLEQALTMLETINDGSNRVSEVKATILNAQNYYYRKIKDYPNALITGKNCIDILEQIDISTSSTSYYGLIVAYSKCNEPENAKRYCLKMIAAAEKENSLVNLIGAYKLLFELEEENENYKEACILINKHNKLKDEYDKANKSKALAELEKKYDMAQKEQEVLKAKNRNLLLYLVIAIIALVASTFFLYFNWMHRRLKEKYARLSEKVKKTKWGFAISKALLSDHHNAYEELEKLLNRHKVNLENPKLYDAFQELFRAQKADYSSRLFSTLVDIDPNFIKQLQQNSDLTSEDIMLAAMIRHGWSIKEISEVFRVSVDAIRKRKTRLENKMLPKEGKNQSSGESLKKI